MLEQLITSFSRNSISQTEFLISSMLLLSRGNVWERHAMAEPTPFNSLGEILASGAEISVAFAMLKGIEIETALARLKQRFGPLRDSDWQQVMILSGEAIQAAVTFNQLPEETVPPADLFPVNPQLFGDDWAGKRLRIVANVRDGATRAEWNLWFDFPDIVSLAELRELIDSKLTELQRKYEKSFTGLSRDELREISIQTLVAERRY